MTRRFARLTGAALLGLVALAPATAAHTDADLVAVPAGAPARVTLEPTHGCGASPTVELSTRVPVEGATADAVTGWTATATPDGKGNTVIEWTGGSLPAQEVGAFPVRFTAPDAVGELLTFPFVQVCENGEELAWISGDPAAEFPAPRLLILSADSAPAETLDDVPPDAPGRDQLQAIVDVDNPREEATTTTTTAPTTTTSTAPAQASDTSSDDGTPWAPLAIGAAVAAAAAAVVLQRRRRR